MQKHKIITTSWDDGYVLDFRLAELLEKYQLKGTFYIPQKNSEQKVMSEEQIKTLSRSFEIGGHTLNHTRLNINNKSLIEQEVSGSFLWLSNLLGTEPKAFAFPGGKYSTLAVDCVFKAGYSVARTTELFKKDTTSGYKLMPTTLQIYQHTGITYTKHLVKRKRFHNLIEWLKKGAQIDLLKLTEKFLNTIDESGGCFHLWGHSWEIEQYNLWNKLEELFKILSHQTNFIYLANGETVTLN